MRFLVDAGNSRIKWSLCEGFPEQSASMAYSTADLPGQLGTAWNRLKSPDSVFVANVAGLEVADILTRYFRENWRVEPVFLTVSRRFNGLVNAYEDIGQMGVDRWLALVAAWTEYQDNLCIVSAGTAITLDLVLAGGRHLGGYIIPGTALMQQLLNRYTDGIDVGSGGEPMTTPGVSTHECVQNGGFLAVTALIERVIHEHQDRYGGGFRCIISGGDARMIGEGLSVAFKWEPDLVFKGMAIVSGDGE